MRLSNAGSGPAGSRPAERFPIRDSRDENVMSLFKRLHGCATGGKNTESLQVTLGPAFRNIALVSFPTRHPDAWFMQYDLLVRNDRLRSPVGSARNHLCDRDPSS
ncbi:hypothetical protein RB7180 [Rhodopirellula baltica SH 1]|uniref:Uncharacterized protein n=1 Tax=Rhodopirellula baltica (strain DSM 10527 / NCIMB 13988 / SH1) TaxID=243090 RepID=Q7UP41_RHOBA|nr:hypothetical protein RB7180 [Rhodopirellula baltica SH 1]